MSKTKFSSDLFEQLGGVSWSVRPNGAGFAVPKEAVQNTIIQADELELQVDLEVTNPVAEYADHSAELVQKEGVAESQVEYPADSELGNHIVVLGAGLDAVWQNDENQAWLLWQNIMLAFGWDEANIVFFDTAHLVSEDMVFSTMEEVIELGVDWVLTMDEEHAISEQLQEGVHVVTVPDLELMLSDPYSKQVFYQSVVTVTSGL